MNHWTRNTTHKQHLYCQHAKTSLNSIALGKWDQTSDWFSDINREVLHVCSLSQGFASGSAEVHVKEHAFTPFLTSLLPDCDVEGKVGGIFLWTDRPALPIRKIPPPSLPALSSIPPPPLSLSALYARTGAEKSAGQGTQRKNKTNNNKKQKQLLFFSFSNAFLLHHYERTGAPAHKNLRCVHTHTHTLWHSLSRRINSAAASPVAPGIHLREKEGGLL